MQSLGDIVGRYTNLFGKDGGGVDSDSAWYAERYGWAATLDNLCNGDYTKRNYYLDLGVIEFLNILAQEKDKQKLIKQQLNKK